MVTLFIFEGVTLQTSHCFVVLTTVVIVLGWGGLDSVVCSNVPLYQATYVRP